MKVVTDITGIIDALNPKSGLINISKAELCDIFVDLNCAITTYENGESFDNVIIAAEKLRMFMNRIKNAAEQTMLNIAMIKAPLYQSNEYIDLESYIELVKESIVLAAEVGYIIVDPIPADGKDMDKLNTKFYMSIAKTAEKYSVMVLIRNTGKHYNGRAVRHSFSDSEYLAAFTDKLNAYTYSGAFGTCFDVGTAAALGQDTYEFVMRMGTALKAVIIRECADKHDKSAMPFLSGGTEIRGAVTALREISYDGAFLYSAVRTFSDVPTLLHTPLLRLLKDISKFLSWQLSMENSLKKYSHIVLFGAGNMCRNYMMSYGKKYPPLFTCDNNEALWNTEIYGLCVKSPAELKDISEDTGVFICNVYYREIHEQLKSMGVKNIEFFHDEYLPKAEFKRD